MVSFWPSPRKIVLIRDVFVAVNIRISRNELRGYIAMLATSSPFLFGAQGANRSIEMAWMQIIFAVSC